MLCSLTRGTMGTEGDGDAMPYANRAEAARRLCGRLKSFAKLRPLVLGIPRGGVPMAKIIADSLNGELDVVLVHKLRSPLNPELAIGSIDEQGNYSVMGDGAEAAGTYIEREIQEQLQTMRLRRQSYTPHRDPIPAHGRLVILVDDGIATGSTMRAAIDTVRRDHPAKIVVATGVASGETLRALKCFADEVICLETPDPFYAVGQAYADFSSVDDDEIIRLLTAASPV